MTGQTNEVQDLPFSGFLNLIYRQFSRLGASWNTSTIAPRAIEGAKREPGAWRYNWATLSLGDINTDLALQVGG
jgi:hypothetical protein